MSEPFNPSARITRGKVVQPLRVLLHGPPGVGKSTFGAQAPKPFFVCAEDNSNHLNVAGRFCPRSDLVRQPDGSIQSGWTEVLGTIRWLQNPENEPEMGTLVLDTIDWLEAMVVAYICARDNGTPDPTSRRSRTLLVDGKPHINGYSYGGGWATALEEWRVLLAELDRLRKIRGAHIVLLAHSGTNKVSNVEGFDYDLITPKINKLATGLVVEWSDAVLYADWERVMIQAPGDNSPKAKMNATGKRIVYTTHENAHIAKGRDLPRMLPLEWAAFYEHARAAFTDPVKAAKLRADIDLAVGEDAEPAFRSTVDATVAKAGDNLLQLQRIHDKLIAKKSTNGAAATAAPAP